MVIDSSALVALILREADHHRYAAALRNDRRRMMSAVSHVEASMVLATRLGDAGLHVLDDLIERSRIEIVAVDRVQALAARDAFLRFGRGRHPARLNMGDCFSYALASVTGQPLLYKGDDFGLTDLAAIPLPPPHPGG